VSDESPPAAMATHRSRTFPWIVAGAVAAGLVLFFVGLRSLPSRQAPLPVLATVPDFTLTSSAGRPIRRGDLLGQPWIADLMFTRCAGVCPRLTSEMARLEEGSRDRPGTKFVSISVDPETDTPDVLAAYAKKLDVERDRWFFLTGEREAVYELVRAGLLLPAEEGDPQRGEDPVIHSSRFVLIDSLGRIRGFYDSRDSEALLRLRSDLRRVDDAPVS